MYLHVGECELQCDLQPTRVLDIVDDAAGSIVACDCKRVSQVLDLSLHQRINLVDVVIIEDVWPAIGALAADGARGTGGDDE